MDGWIGGRVGGLTDGWMDGWMDKRMGGWVYGWMDWWVDGWVRSSVTFHGSFTQSRDATFINMCTEYVPFMFQTGSLLSLKSRMFSFSCV